MDHQEAIAVVGLGYVGLPLALLASTRGYPVYGIDVNEAKIAQLNQGQSPLADQASNQQILTSRIAFSTDFDLVANAAVIIICVPTPIDEQSLPDLTPIRSACAKVARHLRPGQLVILESTVNPGVCEGTVLPALEAGSGLVCGRDFHLAHCPERINPGDRTWNVANIPRVIGSFDPAGLERAAQFYRSIINAEIRPMASLKEAEAVKVVENSFRDINIAFVNELAMSFDKLGISLVNVIEGAATKPFAFMPHFPGCGVGGHCIPVDPYYLIEYAREHGFNHELLQMARRVNRRMPIYTAELTAKHLAEQGINIAGARVTLLGLAYKADIADTRESPAFEIAKTLREMGAEVVTYDPHVTGHQSAAPSKKPAVARVELAGVAASVPSSGLPDTTRYEKVKAAHRPLAHAIHGADAVVVATGHRLFREADPAIFADAGVKLIIDGRNCLDRSGIEPFGITYKGIGH